jgi:hypothetical protein
MHTTHNSKKSNAIASGKKGKVKEMKMEKKVTPKLVRAVRHTTSGHTLPVPGPTRHAERRDGTDTLKIVTLSRLQGILTGLQPGRDGTFTSVQALEPCRRGPGLTKSDPWHGGFQVRAYASYACMHLCMLLG